MAGTNMLVRQKDLIAGSGISITPDTTSGNVTIAATSTAIDESRLVPTGGKEGEILSYQEGADRGNSDNVRLLLQNALTDSANGNAAPAAVTTQGVTLTDANDLLFDGNDSHVTAVLATDEIFAADKEWTIDFWMKPTANSSEWNYILTENTGDWGSHSIGLTWNKSKSVLEQDTGGYVASVIKAPNWPNNSIACAVGEWHFVAVEKQKTATGWSLNYYLNGAIWLQVAFTGEFVPFTSDNPFWFGGKTTDSGRWFKGEANKLRVTTGARYGGKAFAVPDRLTDYAAPAGQPVWTEGIDRSRLLPENPANGDIPCYSDEPPEGVNYNDANTVLLLQGSSDNTAAAPTAERLNGIVTGEFPVQADGSILVNGTSNYITFNDADARRVFSGEFTLETYIKTTQFTASGKRQDTNWCVVYRNGGSVTDYQWLLLSDFYADAGKFGIWPYPQMSGETFPKTLVNAEFQHVAIDVYMVDGVRKFTMYRNGVPYHTGNYWSTTPADWSSGVSAAMRLFGEGPSGGDDYLSNASVMSLRVSNVARYKGVSFDPPADGKYLNPPAGYWGKLNKAELVKSVNGQTPDSSGAVTLPEATTSAAGLMSATDREKSIGLTTRGFYPNALANARAVDFNEVIDHGFYFIGGDTPHLNYPETYQQNGGTLQVIRNGNYLTQTFIPLNINKVFIRTCMNALSDSSVHTFSAWRRALTAPDITESKARPGYFKLPGGTIVQWGKKTAITQDEENCYIAFPIAFPTMFLAATAIASSGTLSATGVIVSLSEVSTTSMTMVVKNHPNTGSPDVDQYIEIYWFAVGF